MPPLPRLLRVLILLFGVLIPGLAHAGWTRMRPVVLTSTLATPTTNIQVPVEISFSDGLRPDGGDVRFASMPGADVSESFDLPYFIESWNAGGTSLVWVKIPSMPGSSSKTIYLYYGNPGATTTSNFAVVFPNAYRLLGGTDLQSGIKNYDWFEIAPGAALFVFDQSPLIVHARRALINGALDASGRGYVSSFIAYGNGNGPGGGLAGFSGGFGGAGGAGYGGWGGSGGGVFPAAGGPSDGTAASGDIDLGSSGGNGEPNAWGGNGGGSVTVDSRWLTQSASGWVNANGNGANSASTTGGGGGSGGGILLRGYELRLSGNVTAAGGFGATAGASGGGGGGGRIKLMYGHTAANSAVVNVNGGMGGTGASPGASGSISSALVEWPEITSTVGAEQSVAVEPRASSGVRVGPALPNPARTAVTLALQAARPGDCRIEIVDLQGRKTRTLDRPLAAGAQEISWDLHDDRGTRVPVGIYLANVTVDRATWSRRIVVIR